MAITTKALAAALIALLAWPQGALAQMKVIISGGFSGAYEQLLPEFEQASGIKVTTDRAPRRVTGRKPSARSSPAARRPMS